ncbi:1-phosphofructokinase [Orenia marismortui]|uniref:Tagatose-6-phosphate kinase n=1 Tax=Orenia marismortui TaxID=46469 RepID=A0A4R8GPQ2_9FIRM|nr:1-phosphofructokinase [Orenia marismortui]TDX45304.1 fructose-1-phosphate kinase [Orenia marismortui]
MIITLTLNPAVDKTVKISKFTLGALNRIKAVRKDAGGKGINVSKVISELGGETKAFGFIGGSSGGFIKESLSKLNIYHNFTLVKDDTRTNLKIIDINNKQETEVNEPGPQITNIELCKLEKGLLDSIDQNDLIIMGGSLPQGLPQNTYASLIEEVQSKGAKVILDTSNKPLIEGLKAKPYLVKPNLDELETLFNKRLDSIDKIVESGKKLYQQGIKIVVISLGGEGSIVISREGVWKIRPPKVKVASTIGAGDTLVGSLSLKLNEGVDLKEALLYATAASASTVTKAGTQICSKEEVKNLVKEVKIEILE